MGIAQIGARAHRAVTIGTIGSALRLFFCLFSPITYYDETGHIDDGR